MRFASLVKQTLHRAGIEARRYTVQTSAAAQLGRILAHLGVDMVFDVGAHEGQYASGLRAHGYRGGIVSFEPLSAAHARLVEASRSDPAWEVAPRVALGDFAGKLTIHVSAHSPSSSILEMLPLHEQAVPGSGIVGSEQVQVARFDRAALSYIRNDHVLLLKIDTQGYEDRVLAGAAGVIDHITAIQTELSLVPLYAEQLLFDEMRAKIEAMGFELFAIFPGHVHEVTGRTLQVDGLFLRRETVEEKA